MADDLDAPRRATSWPFTRKGTAESVDTDRSKKNRTGPETWSFNFDVVETLLRDLAKDTPAQVDFFAAFQKKLAAPLLSKKETNEPQGHFFTLSTCMTRLEVHVQVAGMDPDDWKDAARKFLEKGCGLGDQREVASCLRRLEHAILCDPSGDDMVGWRAGHGEEEAHEVETRRSSVSRSRTRRARHGEAVTAFYVWCVLDGMGTTEPFVDAGFSFEWGSERLPVEWSALEMLMPPSDDVDVLLDYAMAEQACIKAKSYSCSLMPAAPEHTLQFRLKDSRAATMHGLLFFKCLDFPQPHRRLLSKLAGARQNEVHVVASFGAKGLTRLTLRLHGISVGMPKELSQVIPDAQYAEQKIEQLKRILQQQGEGSDLKSTHPTDLKDFDFTSSQSDGEAEVMEPGLIEFSAVSAKNGGNGFLLSLGFREH
mmetsp:Transcript_9753/g.28321  ORF Transcript_9753/g.28321 Transcript_9753/m.28321 type:complete len:425 (-) Transcript_9753:124-1398(-)|eukprot:CAMPEP_0176067282 /NCGR_PEP_ID=MMETSP0120_2-20121206/33582_1 /TAXON_ID=160619 /ORGANISM="Kryptoperidinium foliaceum, Strain CCMP 1326" /LENGTH=424 /DNA_ID=CAMNT_0017400897 /DNA_START=60 /DNA_END=1334 /DNA_ORIENTATION=+